MATRRELVAAIRVRYQQAARGERSRILDEFVAITGYHRKHAIRILAADQSEAPPSRSVRPRRYGPQTREVLVRLWEASDRVCGKRLKAMIPLLLGALERHSGLNLDDPVRAQLLEISPATIDRMLKNVREQGRAGQRRRAGFASAIRRSVPIRTFADWGDPAPGFVEVDMVAHSGETAEGSFIQTLTLTDIATGWTECLPLLVRSGSLVIEALDKARTLFPFPLRGVDFDNDSSFMNEAVVTWCREAGLEVSRSRAYKKNDQAWVEQKNGAIVRRLVGYSRYSGLPTAEVLAHLYQAARLHVNFFQASFKLKEKTRVGARVTKRYHPPCPPYERVLAHPAVSEEAKERLRAMMPQLDPITLLAQIRASQETLSGQKERQASPPSSVPATDVKIFAETLAVAWKEGEHRATHRRVKLKRKPWKHGRRPFDHVRAEIEGLLAKAPSLLASDILEYLMRAHPGQFSMGQKRTLQREVKAMRAAAAKRIILEGHFAPTPDPVGERVDILSVE